MSVSSVHDSRRAKTSEVFDVPPSTLSRVINEADVALATTLKALYDAQIVFPSKSIQHRWTQATAKSEPLFTETRRQLYLKLCNERLTVSGTDATANTAFPVLKGTCGKIVTPLKQGDLERIHTDVQLVVTALSNAVTSLGQAAELEMGVPSKCDRASELSLSPSPATRARCLVNIYRL
ncbi:hypothetical protein PybrP1_011131 [[Pythium] brassicae (nom. inval.)]|nr:hypothetical protein PybrP1_011131 [[Pythium] brassicae (nom. inval.)]